MCIHSSKAPAAAKQRCCCSPCSPKNIRQELRKTGPRVCFCRRARPPVSPQRALPRCRECCTPQEPEVRPQTHQQQPREETEVCLLLPATFFNTRSPETFGNSLVTGPTGNQCMVISQEASSRCTPSPPPQPRLYSSIFLFSIFISALFYYN